MELDWDTWKQLDDRARLSTAEAILDDVRQTKPAMGAPQLRAFGPNEDCCPITVVEDAAIATTFALVPGGILRPGLDAETLHVFWELQKEWLTRLRRKAEHERPYTAKEWSPDQLVARAPVRVSPMLVALQPLDHRALGVERPRFAQRPLMAHHEAEDAATRLGYSVPTSDELEWATTAGTASLFPWGDELPEPMDPRSEVTDRDAWEERAASFARTYMALASDAVAPWPTSGRFGLQGAGGQPVWCTGPSGDGLVAGGADRFFPWQGCGEWLWLISAVRVPAAAIERHQGAMLRPVLRLSTLGARS